MNSWIRNFKPTMVIYPEDEVLIVEPVCAQRVLRVRRAMAIRDAGNNKLALKLLGA